MDVSDETNLGLDSRLSTPSVERASEAKSVASYSGTDAQYLQDMWAHQLDSLTVWMWDARQHLRTLPADEQPTLKRMLLHLRPKLELALKELRSTLLYLPAEPAVDSSLTQELNELFMPKPIETLRASVNLQPAASKSVPYACEWDGCMEYAVTEVGWSKLCATHKELVCDNCGQPLDGHEECGEFG